MKQANLVSYEQNVIVNFIVNILCRVLLQALTTIVSKQSLMSKIYTQSHFVQMLQNTTDSSNSEVIIMFPGQNFIQIVIHGDNVR